MNRQTSISELYGVIHTVAWFVDAAEKRQADESLSSVTEEPRRKKIEGDVPSDVVAEILEVTSDPKKMLGPDVCAMCILDSINSAVIAFHRVCY